jgi:hypothetical protein
MEGKNNENTENQQKMGSDKTPNGDSNEAEDTSHATNEDLEGN